MRRTISLLIPVLLTICAVQESPAQSREDSLTFISTDWNWKKLDKGAEAGGARLDLFGSTQTISIVKYPASRFRTTIINSPGEKAGPADSLAAEHGAAIAINGSFFDTKTLYPHTFFSYRHRIAGISDRDEAARSNGILAFKNRRGKKIDIFLCDTTSYEKYRTRYWSAIASGPLLIQDGKTLDFARNSFNTTRHPRSVIGKDGTGFIYFIVIDGRFPGQGDGMTITETAAIARYLGLEDAINMDGGGSSTLWTEATGVLNHPSDNKKFDHEGCRTVPNIVIAY